MAKNLRRIGLLMCVCAVIALLVAGCGDDTGTSYDDRSPSKESSKLDRELMEVMPEGSDFDEVDVVDYYGYDLPSTVTKVYEEGTGLGYVIELTTTGYGPDMVILCGISADGTVTGAKCLSSTETLGKEKEYGKNFVDKDAAGVDAVDTINGATMTTTAYKKAIKDAQTTVLVLNGADVDVRTPEEILTDNLATALPAGEGAFTKVFLTEVLEGVDAVYIADNGAGYVCVIGEHFVDVNAEGNSDNAVAATAVKALKDSTSTEVDLTAYEGIDKNVIGVKKTASGNYVLEVKGAGYGIRGGNEYHPASGEYIIIRVSMTADGKIIDCLTVSQAETTGLGDQCASEDFTSRFDGKSEADIEGVDGISGATFTTDGYKNAILRCFAAVAILEGGAR